MGTPPSAFQDWETTKVYFHNFAELTTDGDGDGYVKSSRFSCLGHRWRLWFDLYEVERCGEDESWLSIMIQKESSDDIDIKYGFSIKDCNDDNIVKVVSPTERFEQYRRVGWEEMITRQKALNNLIMGTLVVEVRMKRRPEFPFIPKNPSVCKTVQGLFMDKDTADIVFEVGGKQNTDMVIHAKTFVAHSLILKKAAPLLAEICGTNDAPSAVHIPNVSPDTFHHLLYYIYGLDIPAFGAVILHTKEIIEAADRYGLSNLKLEAEAYYVSSMTLTLENVMEHLHFADSKNCALLREAIIDFIIKNNKAEGHEQKLLSQAPINLANDILAAIMRVEKKDRINFNNDFSAMSISELVNICSNQ